MRIHYNKTINNSYPGNRKSDIVNIYFCHVWPIGIISFINCTSVIVILFTRITSILLKLLFTLCRAKELYLYCKYIY